MAIEKFDNRRLHGQINVACKTDRRVVGYWRADKATVVSQIVGIVNRYQQMGYKLTLRQLHYQFVGHVPGYINHDTAYKKLGKILDDCRYAGLIDWNNIEDRGRIPQLPYWVHGISDALRDSERHYRLDRQQGQDNYIEVWTEKDALSGIFSRVTQKYHVYLTINKGHTSSSAMYRSYRRFVSRIESGQQVKVLYFGDHDPSGLDMIRDINERIRFFGTQGEASHLDWDNDFEVIPIGLNMNQIKQYNLPPNPTKMTDSRTPNYVRTYGHQCWEVDALDAPVLNDLIEQNILQLIDNEQYLNVVQQEVDDKKKLQRIIKKYDK